MDEHIIDLSRIYSMEKVDVVGNFTDAWQDYLNRYMDVEYSKILREKSPFGSAMTLLMNYSNGSTV